MAIIGLAIFLWIDPFAHPDVKQLRRDLRQDKIDEKEHI